ncbi:MAG: prolipoprotein diacylglyceryl transferase [Dethiobacter sp.]|jgi:phosphatidylglycerol:prolipoprotein diacylglycerol transferase|nr:prolipoprotein diacylglyceryl transferase [Dethiobacter sp.]MBS3900889.1 prolipoprotein diacylglyceryl transferase [Dethiobacter sp.]MBS3990385.1 prolipoprotein diacylglyceryl transferase [Dethiobacter sp.]
MYPVLFRIGGISIYSYAVLLTLAFIIGTLGVSRGGKRAGLPAEKLLDMAMWILIASLVGARLLFILIELPMYLADPLSVFHVRSGGLSFHGGLIGGIAAGLWYTHRHKLPQGKVADLVAPYLALGYGIVRIGCLLNGCCFGIPANLPWALPGAAADSTLRHPTQLYAFFAGIIIFGLLLWRKNKIRFNGQLFLEFILLYSIYRFFIEYYREVSAYAGILTLGQSISLIGAVGAYVAIRIWPLGRRNAA